MAMIKNSKQRDAVIRILQSTDTHPTAEWVYEKMREEFPHVSLATVYRNLRCMIEAGMAREIYTDNSSRFDGNMCEHYHFLCEKCNNLFDVLPQSENEAVKSLEETGFKVNKCDISFFGICANCGGNK